MFNTVLESLELSYKYNSIHSYLETLIFNCNCIQNTPQLNKMSVR
jgi:hypothetical protein